MGTVEIFVGGAQKRAPIRTKNALHMKKGPQILKRTPPPHKDKNRCKKGPHIET